jgi:hypothetical protein
MPNTKAKTKSTIKAVSKSTQQPNTKKTSTKSDKNGTLLIVIFLLFILCGLFLAYMSRYALVASIVNGVEIKKSAVLNQLENAQGKQALDTLIVKELLMQEATKRKITVSDSEIDEELNKIKDQLSQQGQKLEDVLATQGMSFESVRSEIRYQKLLEKLLADSITVSEEEITNFINENKAQLPESKTGTDTAALRDSIRSQLKSQKIGTQAQTFIEELKKNAKIQYFGSFQPLPTPSE